MDPLRTQRVAESMREELSELIRFESADPRLANIDVTEVVVASDMSRADVLVHLPGTAVDRAAAMAGLESARQYLRVQLSHRIELFRMPELRFVPAATSSSDAPIGRLRRRARRGRSKPGAEPTGG